MAFAQRRIKAGQGQQGRSFMGGFNVRSVTTWLIIINVLVYIVDEILISKGQYQVIQSGTRGYAVGLLKWYGHFSSTTVLQDHDWWRFITFQFLHANFLHLAMNMMGMYFMGPLIEMYLGRARYLAFYLICGCAGGGAYLLLRSTGVLIHPLNMPLVGASAGLFGILMAAARIAPNAWVQLIFPPVPVKLKEVAWVLFGVAVITIFTHGQNAGGEAGHLGGAIVGFIIIAFFKPQRELRVP